MNRAPHAAFWFSLLLALLLQLVMLPEAVAAARPLWLPLMLVYWALMEPRVPVLATALLFGLVQDVMFNTILGQHALGLVLLVYLVARLRGVFVLFPLWQSTLVLAPVWMGYCLLMAWIDTFTHHRADELLRWLPALSTMLFWPLVYSILDGFHRRRDVE
jgi:rod shape-determining protein MreD